MQKKNFEVIWHHIKCMQQKKWVNFRFNSLLCVAFLLQNFSFATLQINFGFNNLNSGTVQNIYFEKGSDHHQDSELELFIEVAAEDEDEVHNNQDFYNAFYSGNQSSNAQHYSNAINILYLSLASTNQHKVDLPFFILYHSWKSDLA